MRDPLQPCVYLLASRRNGTLYAGVTSNLIKRIHEHRIGAGPGFTSNYDVKRLMWYEPHQSMEKAIQREKRIKKWNRQWKIQMIEQCNPYWDDLAIGLGFPRLPD